jgi:hypothetical protein
VLSEPSTAGLAAIASHDLPGRILATVLTRTDPGSGLLIQAMQAAGRQKAEKRSPELKYVRAVRGDLTGIDVRSRLGGSVDPNVRAPPGDCRKRRCKADVSINWVGTVVRSRSATAEP